MSLNIVVCFVGYLCIMDLINAWKIECIKINLSFISLRII